MLNRQSMSLKTPKEWSYMLTKNEFYTFSIVFEQGLEINLNTGLVSRDDQSVRKKLTDKQLSLIRLLYDNCDNENDGFVSRAHLISKLWIRGSISPESVSQIINRTRTALKDTDKALILNEVGMGYKLASFDVKKPFITTELPIDTVILDSHVRGWRKFAIVNHSMIFILLAFTIVQLFMLAFEYRSKTALVTKALGTIEDKLSHAKYSVEYSALNNTVLIRVGGDDYLCDIIKSKETVKCIKNI